MGLAALGPRQLVRQRQGVELCFQRRDHRLQAPQHLQIAPPGQRLTHHGHQGLDLAVQVQGLPL
ncbi:hypothetical protein MSS93_14595 [Deinococcus radiodurans]|nr:hypothetical protein MSS93_14595 [Deinococcus radiodurans]